MDRRAYGGRNRPKKKVMRRSGKPAVLHCMIVPTEQETLLLPTSVMAEVIDFQQPRPTESAPPWLLGQVEWEGRDTYIQRNGIVQDFGVFDSPDSFYVRHRQNFGFFRELMYRVVVRHWMNARVRALRTGRLVANVSATHSHGNSGESV